jgi:uncharacterized membrane protein
LEIRIGIRPSGPILMRVFAVWPVTPLSDPAGQIHRRASILKSTLGIISSIMAIRFIIALCVDSRKIFMHRMHGSIETRPRILLAAAWGTLCAVVVAAPLLASHSCHNVASVLYMLFSQICHQIPERSFSLCGYPLPVCHRCCGIYAGLFLGCFVVTRALHGHPPTRRLLVLAAIIVLGVDALAPAAGLWNSSAFSRFSTGLAFGIVTSILVVRGLAEFVQEFSWRRLAPLPAPPKGELA